MAFYGRCYSLRNLYNLDPEVIKQTLDSKGLMNYENYCQEAEKEIAKIRQEIADQFPKLQEIQIKKYIEVERLKQYGGKVVVYVHLMTETKLNDYVNYHKSDNKIFTGKEKKQALEYAESLRGKYGYGINKINWK